MSRGALVRGLALALGSALLMALVIGLVYDASGAIGTFEILAPLGLATVAATHFVVARRRHLGSLRRQALVTAALAFSPGLLALAIFVQVMFLSGHDAILAGLAAIYSALLGLWAGRLLSYRVMDDVDTLRAGLMAVGAGEREIELRVGGMDELAQVAAEVEAMVGQLAAAETRREDSEAARRALIAAVSHDLRTPVTALRLLAEAVADEIGDPDTRREYVRRLGVHIRALGGLIDDLFELTQIEAGAVAWSMRAIDLDELVEDTVAAMQPTAEAGGIAVHASSRTRFATRPPTAASPSARRGPGRASRSRSRTRAAGSRPPIASGSSSPSSRAPTARRAPTAARASASPSRGRSSRRTADASGSSTTPPVRSRPAPACASACRLRHPPDAPEKALLTGLRRAKNPRAAGAGVSLRRIRTRTGSTQ